MVSCKVIESGKCVTWVYLNVVKHLWKASKDALIFTVGKLCKLHTEYDLNNVNYIGK